MKNLTAADFDSRDISQELGRKEKELFLLNKLMGLTMYEEAASLVNEAGAIDLVTVERLIQVAEDKLICIKALLRGADSTDEEEALSKTAYIQDNFLGGQYVVDAVNSGEYEAAVQAVAEYYEKLGKALHKDMYPIHNAIYMARVAQDKNGRPVISDESIQKSLQGLLAVFVSAPKIAKMMQEHIKPFLQKLTKENTSEFIKFNEEISHVVDASQPSKPDSPANDKKDPATLAANAIRYVDALLHVARTAKLI